MSRGRPLFVTGPARSGSTLLAHMLNAHRSVAMASDIFFPLFRALRSAVIRQSGESFANWSENSSLEDYYFLSDRIRRLDLVQACTLSEGVEPSDQARLAAAVQARAAHESPDIATELALLRGDCFRDLFARGLDTIASVRPRTAGGWTGAKDVWSVEFLRPLARAFPEARFIILLRDPRAMMASMLAITAQDPNQVAHTLSYARHWRKYVAFWLHYRQDPDLAARVHLVRYEQLVLDPAREAQLLCEFLELPFDAAMIDTSQFRSSAAAPSWQGNSSFENRSPQITPSHAERWRKRLPSVVRELVDYVCGPEMQAVGYDTSGAVSSEGAILDYLVANNRQYCSWRSDLGDVQQDWGFELFRRTLLALSEEPERDLIRRSFLFDEVFSCLRTF